ncbi:hypothetical protein Bhyg_17505 [Pseudolycoriella hygida]|uniref:Kinase D-interacting substrate of 220 kDa-like SAM domain-containing protein n=1 Tax=Pseudolycoriella hygida TaxID=35572 RepID=A0A9Q0RU99_9DIPT|nr:hypothetical protein Bhyg_17293 [Pseudolycoriella hygida]KAJ6634438.1 hypothetical protein Bhyg_17505 [Pseudolycoriella hygida]
MNEIKTKSSPLQRVKESGQSIINSIRKKENRLKESIAKVFFGKSKNDPRVGATTNTTSVTTAGPTQDENKPLMGEISNSTLGIENPNLSSKSADSGDDSYLMHRFATIFPSDFLSIKLIKLSPKEVQEMLGQVHYFKEILGHLCQIVEMYRLDGITLSFTNLEVLKESLNLEYGYWELFKILILGLRRLQSE